MTVKLQNKTQIYLNGTYKSVMKQARRFIAKGFRCVGFIGLRRNGKSTALVMLEK
ncbi:hypothetical protein [Dissulfuribacter thermophilus]|uniref:hypothetical protein n=1 Tax=Dissulfuribacter thermophilus TaxID=1156395 RepID=UPI0012946589|nr:hypothetical protein [Dissulfuribacter thermophilus]